MRVPHIRRATGIFTWPIGDRYEGHFHKDQCHGVGIMSYADGRVYKGQWAENKKHGCVGYSRTSAKHRGGV